jgi:predicted DNA-binding transcriptional regulator YafY
MASAIVRQWLILTMLPKPPRRIDSGALEARLRDRGVCVHRRTIQRDLIELAEVFPILSDERSKPYGWRWTDDAAFVDSLPLPRALVTAASASAEVVIRAPRTALSLLVELIGGRAPRIADDHRSDPAYASVTLSIDDSAAARRRLFAHSDELEVLAPRAIREEITALARRSLTAHSRALR